MKILHGADQDPKYINGTANFTPRPPCSRTNFLFVERLEHEKHIDDLSFVVAHHQLERHAHDLEIRNPATFIDHPHAQIPAPLANPALAA